MLAFIEIAEYNSPKLPGRNSFGSFFPLCDVTPLWAFLQINKGINIKSLHFFIYILKINKKTMLKCLLEILRCINGTDGWRRTEMIFRIQDLRDASE